MATIESQDLSVSKLFNDFYIVPSYQREYVWTKSEVEDFFKDIYDEFNTSENSKISEYFIGSIIVCLTSNGLYEVIDGQQRITTSYLLLCAIKFYLKTFNQDIDKLNNQISATDIDEDGNNIFRYRVTLQYEDSRGILEKIAQQQDLSEIIETSSTQNIKNAYLKLISLLKEEFDSLEPRDRTAHLRKFYAYFTGKVLLVRVKTATLADALRVFATINYRGVNLDSIDLIKNLMFMEAKKQEYEIIKKEWKRMNDLLFKAKENPIRFIRYYLIAYYVESNTIKEKELYDWFLNSRNKAIYQNSAVSFVKNLLSTSEFYLNLLNCKNIDNTYNKYINNLRCLSDKARTPFMVLLSARHLPVNLFMELSRHIENLFFIYLITKESTRNFENIFCSWCIKLRKVTNESDFYSFLNENIVSHKNKFKQRFESSFLNLSSDIPKTQLKYILAKLTKYIDEIAYGEDLNNSLDTYINRNVEIEHILPQKPSESFLNVFSQEYDIESYINKLGNITLLEKPLNSSISNKSFTEKKEAYMQSKFLLTKTIAIKVTIGRNTAIDRAVAKLSTFEEWNAESIEKRQLMLTHIAKTIWDIS